MIQVLGLGTGRRGTLTLEVLEMIKNATAVTLQTGTLDVAEYLSELGVKFETLDDIYESTFDFDELTQSCVSKILKTRGVFCVPGSAYTNEIVKKLAQTEEITIVGGVDHAGYAADRSCIFSPNSKFATADEFLQSRAYTDGIFAVTDVDVAFKAADVALMLQRWYGQEHPCFLCTAENVKKLKVKDLIKVQKTSYDTVFVLPPLSAFNKPLYDFDDLARVIEFLRSEQGCPWDREQTHQSLRPYMLEESYEAMEAIDKDDMNMLEDELGDVALQVVLHSQIAKECGEFDAYDVLSSECEKMIYRHSHVFGTDEAETAADVVKNWDKLKAKSKGQNTLFETLNDMPKSMSPLLRAGKVLRKAKVAGVVRENPKKTIPELLAKLSHGDDITAGKLLLAIVELLRENDISADVALEGAIREFIEQSVSLEEHRT